MDSAFSIISSAVIDIITLKFSRRTVQVFYVVLVALLAYLYFFADSAPTETALETKTPEVSVASVRSMVSGTSFTAVGAVTAVSEARLQTEAGGRITAVNVTLGDTVAAGTILARVENAAESAALLQAQGAYEAALAGAAQGSSGLRDAENGLANAQNGVITTYKSLFTSVSGVLQGTIDQYFSSPNTTIPGVRISGTNVSLMNSTRVRLQQSIKNWQTKSTNITTNDDLSTSLDEAEAVINDVLTITDQIIIGLNRDSDSDIATDEEKRAKITQFSNVRAGLAANLAAIDSARNSLTSANEALTRAKIASTGGTVSSADAQVKIALGSLRAAQANYERTLVRTPIAGVVNALYLKAGEYANPGAPAAIVANQSNGLEINTSVSQEDSVKLAVGDTVTIDGTATGTIAAIAGAIDPTTGKVALKISAIESTGLKNGTTVSISFATKAVTEMSEIVIPLSAIKMTGSGPVVFTVNDETKLVAVPVTLGPINGENVVVAEGVTLDTNIVVDARGLKEGMVVAVTTK